jgi:hypothetical protein
MIVMKRHFIVVNFVWKLVPLFEKEANYLLIGVNY